MKFKNAKPKRVYKKSKPKEQKFPSNSRFIPEKLRGGGFAFLVGALFILASIFVISLDLYSNYKENQALNMEKTKVLEELTFWQKEVEKRPDYRDGYFKLALLNYQLKNLGKSKDYLGKALSLDPNFEKGREMEIILNNL